MNGQEPARERHLGHVEFRAADESALVAMRAAPPIPSAVAQKADQGGAVAARTAPARGPGRGKQRRSALPFGSVAFEELAYRQSRLKLHLVHRHRTPPSDRRARHRPLSGPPDKPVELGRKLGT